MKRSRVAPLATLVLYFAGGSAWALAPLPEATSQHAADVAPRTRRACADIAAVANRGVRALRAADLVGRNVPIDLSNDGHPRTILRLDDQGTMHMPYLADEAHQPIGGSNYLEAARWASEVVVLNVEQRTWRVDWDAGSLDGTAALAGATDGTAICRFHTAWPAPTLKLLPDAEPGRAQTYRTLLLGGGVVPPTTGIDPDTVQAASNLSDTSLSVVAPSWRVDLMNRGQPMTLIRLSLASSAGRGCDYDQLGLVRDGRLTAVGLGRAWLEDRAPLAPASPALQRQLEHIVCSGVTETVSGASATSGGS